MKGAGAIRESRPQFGMAEDAARHLAGVHHPLFDETCWFEEALSEVEEPLPAEEFREFAIGQQREPQVAAELLRSLQKHGLPGGADPGCRHRGGRKEDERERS